MIVDENGTRKSEDVSNVASINTFVIRKTANNQSVKCKLPHFISVDERKQTDTPTSRPIHTDPQLGIFSGCLAFKPRFVASSWITKSGKTEHLEIGVHA